MCHESKEVMKRASGRVEHAILGSRKIRQVLTMSLVPEQPGGKQSRRQAGEVRQRLRQAVRAHCQNWIWLYGEYCMTLLTSVYFKIFYHAKEARNISIWHLELQ